MKSPFFQYDKALYDLVHSLYRYCYYGSPDEILEINALKNNGKVVLPFIGVYRLPDFSINSEMTNDSFLRRGYRMATSDDSQIEFKNQKVAMHGLPVTLEYQLDVYAMKRDVCDGLTAELLMFLRENPWINVQIMDMGEVIVQFNLETDESVSDNTDITGFDEGNRLYRLSITARYPEAVIYRIDKLPKVSKFNVELENLMLGHSEKEIDLTNRVYYIYSNLVPTRELKDQSLAYIKPALQQYYNDLLSGVKFENSMFLKEYLCKGFDLETVKYRYDKYQLERGMGVSTEDNDDKVITTYSIRKIRFPSSDAESGDEISPDKFRVTSYYYVEVPVYLTIDIQTIDSGSKQLETTEIGGIIKLTKDDDKLYVWELDEALALLD